MIDVSVSRKSFGEDNILKDIRFTVSNGECVALLGPSGIGKTTLLRIVAGLDSTFDGTVSRPNRLAMVFQEPTLLRWRTALQNITLTTGVDASRASAALSEVGLSGKADFYPDQLSLGQQRRLALARAFAAEPEALIMDEPFASLDPDRASAMIALTRDLLDRHSVAALFVTHSEMEAEALAGRILHLSGKPATLSTRTEANGT